eukprot:scaffold19927_cov65-Phaeocystis_antarctica.AAC.3
MIQGQNCGAGNCVPLEPFCPILAPPQDGEVCRLVHSRDQRHEPEHVACAGCAAIQRRVEGN